MLRQNKEKNAGRTSMMNKVARGKCIPFITSQECESSMAFGKKHRKNSVPLLLIGSSVVSNDSTNLVLGKEKVVY